MESKILKGEARGGLQEVTAKKEAELARREKELARRRADEEAAGKQIAALEEAALAREEKYADKAEEVEQKTKKLKKLWKKFQVRGGWKEQGGRERVWLLRASCSHWNKETWLHGALGLYHGTAAPCALCHTL